MNGVSGKSSENTPSLPNSTRNSRSDLARQCLADTAMDFLKRFCAVVALYVFIELMKYLYYRGPIGINDLLMVQFPIETVLLLLLLVLAFDCLDMATENRQRQANVAPETASLYMRFIILPIMQFASKCKRILIFLACKMQLVGNWARQMSRLLKDSVIGIIDILSKLADLIKKMSRLLKDLVIGIIDILSKLADLIKRKKAVESNANKSIVQYNLFVGQNNDQCDDFYDQQQLMGRKRLAIGNGEQLRFRAGSNGQRSRNSNLQYGPN